MIGIPHVSEVGAPLNSNIHAAIVPSPTEAGRVALLQPISGLGHVSDAQDVQEPPKKKMRERAPVLPPGMAAPTIMKGPVLATSLLDKLVDTEDVFASFIAEVGGIGGEDTEISVSPSEVAATPSDAKVSDEKSSPVSELVAPRLEEKWDEEGPTPPLSPPKPPVERALPPPLMAVEAHSPPVRAPPPPAEPKKVVVDRTGVNGWDESDDEKQKQPVVKEAWEYLKPTAIKGAFLDFNSF